MLLRTLLNELVTVSVFILRISEKKANDSKRKHQLYFGGKLLEVLYHTSQWTSSLCLPHRQDVVGLGFFIPLVNLIILPTVVCVFWFCLFWVFSFNRKFQ